MLTRVPLATRISTFFLFIVTPLAGPGFADQEKTVACNAGTFSADASILFCIVARSNLSARQKALDTLFGVLYGFVLAN